MTPDLTVLGRGVYTVTQAARLLRLGESRLVRWTKGYSYFHKGAKRVAPPLVGQKAGASEPSLSFLDLLELLYLEHFHAAGVSVQRLRKQVSVAQRELDTRHPFATNRFRTDGNDVLLQRDRDLVNLISQQLESPRLLQRMLRGDLDVDAFNIAQRWWPLSKKRDVVVDPHRRFGAPVSNSSGITTEVLATAYRAEGSAKRVAWWYEIEEKAVRHAVSFEKTLARAA